MSSLSERLDRVGKALQELAHSAQEELERAVEVGSKRIDLLGLRRSLDRETRALGELALGYIREGRAGALGEAGEAGPVVQRLDELERQIRNLEAGLEEARRRGGRGTGAGPEASK